MGSLARPIEAIVPRTSKQFGGKATHLAALARAGFPVPAAFALPADAAEQFLTCTLAEAEQPSVLLSQGPPPDEARLAELRQKVLSAQLPESLREEVSGALHELLKSGAESVAVRSSSLGEDQDYASAAGMHATFLHLWSDSQVLDAVVHCWASVFQPRVVRYMQRLGLEANAAMGVVIQAMVPADVAGVLFTVNPLTGATDEMVLNAAYGLGSAVTDGRVSPDTYRIHKHTGWVRDRIVGAKATRQVVLEREAVQEEPVDAQHARREALDEQSLQQLVELGRRIERYFGSARDIEWAISGESIYVLQARPVTAFEAVGRTRFASNASLADVDPVSQVWSNLNVGEALPGVATPLTWSVLSGFSDLGFRRAFRALGCSVPDDATLVGNFRGRIYLNLSELVSIAAQLPGLDAHTLSALGVQAELEPLQERLGHRTPAVFVARLPITVVRAFRESVTFDKRCQVFQRQFTQEQKRLHSLDLRVLDNASLEATLWDAQRLLERIGGIMLTAYGTLLAGVLLLQGFLRWRAGERAHELLRDLVSGLQDVESARPGRRLAEIAGQARTDAQARHFLLHTSESERGLETMPLGPTRDAVVRFIASYGHRGVREAELSEPRWREDPTPVLSFIAQHLKSPGQASPEDASGRQESIRRLQQSRRHRGEAELRELVSWPLLPVVEALLGSVRHYMRLREALRSEVIQVLGLFRIVAKEASIRIAVEEPECGEQAAFFLTVEELHAWLRGQLRRVGQIVRRRRMQYLRDGALPDPPATFVGYPTAAEEPTPISDHLEGVGASGGMAEGTARVLASASQIPSLCAGEILVATHADVGWSPAFVLASGIVTEAGGMLSHASVIAREYGVPTVVNVPGATRVIRSGDRVRVDGNSGLVQILASARDSVPVPPESDS